MFINFRKLDFYVDNLTKKSCKACEGAVPSLTMGESKKLLKMVPNWKVDTVFLRRNFKFENFKKALEFVNEVGKIAEKEGHHPDITFGYGYVSIELTTHAIKGLSKNDFILAAKIDKIKL